MMSSDLYGTCTAVTVFTRLVPYSLRYLTQHGHNCNPTVTQDRQKISSAVGIPLILKVRYVYLYLLVFFYLVLFMQAFGAHFCIDNNHKLFMLPWQLYNNHLHHQLYSCFERYLCI